MTARQDFIQEIVNHGLTPFEIRGQDIQGKYMLYPLQGYEWPDGFVEIMDVKTRPEGKRIYVYNQSDKIVGVLVDGLSN